MPLTELPFSLPASPSIPALKATHGENNAPPRTDHTVDESDSHYQPHTPTMNNAMHRTSPLHRTSPALPHKLQQLPERFNTHTLSLMLSQANHMNMPNDSWTEP
jgi:hypothetical protein